MSATAWIVRLVVVAAAYRVRRLRARCASVRAGDVTVGWTRSGSVLGRRLNKEA